MFCLLFMLWTFLGYSISDLHTKRIVLNQYSRFWIIFALLGSAYYKYQWRAVREFHHGQAQEQFQAIHGGAAERIAAEETWEQ